MCRPGLFRALKEEVMVCFMPAWVASQRVRAWVLLGLRGSAGYGDLFDTLTAVAAGAAVPISNMMVRTAECSWL